MKKCTQIKLATDEITLKIFENSNTNEIKQDLENSIVYLKNLYKDAKTPIRVTGKTLTSEEIDMVEGIIKRNIDVNVSFDSPREMGLSEIKKAFDKEIETSETKYYKGSLRCGQKLEYEGSIVVIGDVNGGAEIIARDNIVILGKLRGIAHAGAKGNKKAIIAAQSIESPQIRISNIVKEIDKEEEEKKEKRKYAYINGENILVE